MSDILIYFVIFGAGIIATIIIFKDMCSEDSVKKPYLKWFTVFILSIWQVGCWSMGQSFNGAFGNHSSMPILLIIFLIIVVIWFIIQFFSYIELGNKKIRKNKNDLSKKYSLSFEFKGITVFHDNVTFVIDDKKFESSDAAKLFIINTIT